MADVLLHPTLKKSQFRLTPITSESANASSLKIYRRHAGADPLHVDADGSPDFAILVVSTVAEATRCSKIYFGCFCLDFVLDAAQESIIFKEASRLNYVSHMEKASEKDLLRHLDLEGGPEMWEFTSEDLTLHLAKHNGTQ